VEVDEVARHAEDLTRRVARGHYWQTLPVQTPLQHTDEMPHELPEATQQSLWPLGPWQMVDSGTSIEQQSGSVLHA
jgi:hypothetical protein